MAPHLAFAAQAFDLGVKCLDPLFGPDLLVWVSDDLMDRRLFDLHERRTAIGERMVFAVERDRQVHQQLESVFVVFVGQHQRQDLRRDRADLDRSVGHRRDRLVGAVELQAGRTDLAGDRWRHGSLDHLPHQVARAFVGHEARRRHLDARRAQPNARRDGQDHPTGTRARAASAIFQSQHQRRD
jgi:hypothetical protein